MLAMRNEGTRIILIGAGLRQRVRLFQRCEVLCLLFLGNFFDNSADYEGPGGIGNFQATFHVKECSNERNLFDQLYALY